MKGTLSRKVGNVTVMCMSPEARELLDRLCEKFKADHEDKDVGDVNGYQALYWACRYSELIEPAFKVDENTALAEMFREDMILAIAETQSDGKERGFHIYEDMDTIGRTSLQVGTAGEVELKLKELPFLSVDFKLISFHTHNGENDKPSTKDITTALALGEDLMCIGCGKNNKPHVTCWRIKLEKVV